MEKTGRETLICRAVWRIMLKDPKTDPSYYSTFETKCFENVVNSDEVPPSKQCSLKWANDKFVLNRKKEKIELPLKEVVPCLVRLVATKKWLEAKSAPKDAPKVAPPPAVDAPEDVTPVDAPKDAPKVAPPPAVDAPEDVTPVDAPEDVTATAIGLPADVTPTDKSGASWFSSMFYEIGGGVWMQSLGLSVNGAAPVQQFGASALTLRIGALLLPVQLSDKWGFETGVFAQADANSSDAQFANIYDFSGGLSFQFAYTLSKGSYLILAPDVTAGAGLLWSNAPTDVGIADKLYWASDSIWFPQMTAGLGAYIKVDTGYNNLSFTIGLHSGGRWFWHKDSVTNLPEGMPSGTAVRLQSPRFQPIELMLGFRY